MQQTAVIIGGAGFLGTAAAAGLRAAGYTVRVLDTAPRLARSADLLKEAETGALDFPRLAGLERQLEGADILFHLACTSTPASSMADLTADAADNIAPSVAIFEAAGRAGIGRVIFASSGGTVYGNPATVPVPETAPCQPLSGYGASKLAIEHYLSLAAGQGGFRGISLRIGNPYGPYQLRGTAIGVIARYLCEIRDGRAPEVWGDGKVVRDYIHIDDIAAAVATAATAPGLETGAYNIGSGTGHSLNAILDTIGKVTGGAPDVRYRPARGFDVRQIVLDNAKFRAAAGWAPRVSLETGIARLWETVRHSEPVP